MSELLSVAEGWTGLLGPFTLKVDGVALNLTGMTVTLMLRKAAGDVTPGGTLTVLNQSSYPGQVTYAPVAADFDFSASGNITRQPYKLRFKVVDAGGKIVYFPNGDADEISVYQA